MTGPSGALVVGSPQQVVDKILREREILGQDRFLLQMSIGAMPHRDVLRAIELLGTEVAPALRKAGAALAAPAQSQEARLQPRQTCGFSRAGSA